MYIIKSKGKIKKYTLSKVKGKFADLLTPLEIARLKNKYKNIRKASILEKTPLEEWTREELLDLIDEYNYYFVILCALNSTGNNKTKKIASILTFIRKGEYKRQVTELYDEYRKN